MKEGWLNCDLNVSWKVWLTMNVERWTLKTDVRWMLKLDDGHPKFKSVYVLGNDLKSNGHNFKFKNKVACGIPKISRKLSAGSGIIYGALLKPI